MAIRMAGLVSNMDTDNIIKELMKAQNLKKTKVDNKITKTEWKQEKWKELNTKIYALYTGSINKMRLQGSFATKKVASSDETKVSVTASANAVTGSHTVQVNTLASAQYITGSKLSDIVNDDGTKTALSGNTKLADIDSSLIDNGELKINFSTNKKSYSLTVTENTTITDFVNAAKQAGINASFDTAQKRFFLSSSNSGVENAFSITTTSVPVDEVSVKDAIRDTVGYDYLDGDDQSVVDNAIDQYKTISDQINSGIPTDSEKAALEEELEGIKNTIDNYAKTKVTTDLKNAYTNNAVTNEVAAQYGVRSYNDVVTEATNSYYDNLGEEIPNDDDLQAALDKAITTEAAKYATAVKSEYDATAPAANLYTKGLTATDSALDSLALDDPATGADPVKNGTNKLLGLGLSTVEYKMEIPDPPDPVDPLKQNLVYYQSGSNINLIGASDSEIVYNGAVINGTTNTLTANGLTFDVHAVTKGTATPQITLSVSKDVQVTYDAVKKFVKDYNEVLKEMNTLYYANTARGYDPLTDEEKDSMTDDQIEKWETKIKDSLLRREDKLGSLLSSMKTSVTTSVEYEGMNYSLASFGIGSSIYTEKGLLHIDGDPEDTETSANKDKLKTALESNPDAVMKTLTTVAGNLYSEMTDKMKASSLNSAMTFYNDKELSKNLKTYKTELSDLEDRLKRVEDGYYKQFSAMEVAMSKLNSQTNSLSSLMGTK